MTPTRQKKNQTIHKYVIEITSKYGDLSPYLISFTIRKQAANNFFAEDFLYFRPELLNAIHFMTNDELSLRIYYIDLGDHTSLIYENDYVISKIEQLKSGAVRFYIESSRKLLWKRRATHSIILDNVTCREAMQKYIEKFDEKFNTKTELYFSNSENINNHKYEKILLPLRKNYKNLVDIAKKYYVLNSPFYIFFDEYNFGDKYKDYRWFRVGVYDFSKPEQLRANAASGGDQMNSFEGLTILRTKPFETSYIDESFISRESWIKEPNSYVPKAIQTEDMQTNKLVKYAPDTINNALKRQENQKKLFGRMPSVTVFSVADFDVRQLKLGNRLLAEQAIKKSQYYYNIIQTNITLTNVDAGNAEAHSKSDSQVFRASAVIDTLVIKS